MTKNGLPRASMEDPAYEGRRDEWADLSLSIQQVVRLAGRWLPAVTLLTFLPYLILWGFPDLPEWPGLWAAVFDAVLWTAVGLVVYAVSAVLHEVVHLLAMVVVARVPLSGIRFGMRLTDGVLYVHSDRPMSARAYRIVLVLPAVVFGLLPAAVGIIQGRGWLILYGYVMLISAIGDLLVLQLIRHVEARTLVRDHPEQVGCQVLVNPSPS